MRDGKVILESAERVVPGDIVVLEQGDNVPADCRLVEAFDVRVNNAAVTGESVPLARDARASDVDEPVQQQEHPAGRHLDRVGPGKGRRLRHRHAHRVRQDRAAHPDGRQSRFTAEKELARLSRLIALLAILIGLLFFAIGWIVGVPFWKDFIFAIGIIVAMVPEGLLPTLTLSLVLATQRMARRNVLIRYLPSVETLGSTTVICTDKTGNADSEPHDREDAVSWGARRIRRPRSNQASGWRSHTAASS